MVILVKFLAVILASYCMVRLCPSNQRSILEDLFCPLGDLCAWFDVFTFFYRTVGGSSFA